MTRSSSFGGSGGTGATLATDRAQGSTWGLSFAVNLSPLRAVLECLGFALMCPTKRPRTPIASRAPAADIIRSLVSEIILTPKNGFLQVELRGDLAGILTVAAAGRPKSPTSGEAGSVLTEQVMTVTANRNLRDVRRVSDLIEQVKMVAGVGFEPTTFRL
jgi:hypothetical protein